MIIIFHALGKCQMPIPITIFRLKMMALRLLLIIAINVVTAAEESAEEVPNCKYSQLSVYGTILPGDEPCMCSKETSCNPHEMCVLYPTEEAEAMLDGDDDFANTTLIESIFANGLMECYALPCDDLSGRWIWYGRNPRPWTQGDFTVWATVEIEQENCQFVLTSSSNGLISDEMQTRKYYGVLIPQELTSFYLFDTQEGMDNYISSPLFDEVDQEGNLLQDHMYIFTQNFGNGAPKVQCSLFGNLVYKGFMSDTLPDDADSFDGTLARDVEGTFSIGDTIAADVDWDSNGGCPEGYPKPWGPVGLSEVKCCDPEAGPGGCPDENGSFDNCWDEGGYCCSDGKWYASEGDGSGNCQDKQLENSQACTNFETVPIVCPDGHDPIPETFCGRGINRADCGNDEYCFIHPTDDFAVCCPGDGEEQPLSTVDESADTCTSDNECTATVRSRFPMQISSGVEVCQCYAASSVDPFDECEGETGATCLVAKCTNTCDGLEGHCLLSLDSNEGTKMCALRPISDPSTSSPTSAPIALPENAPALIASDGPTNTPSANSPSSTSNAAFFGQRTPNAATILDLVVATTWVFLLL